MNRRRCASLAFVLLSFVSIGSASAQSTGIPDAARKGATNAAVEKHLPAIEAHVQEQVIRLQDNSAKVRAEGRRNLVNPVATGDPSAMFLFTYGKLISQELAAPAAHESLPVRLNTAVAIAEIAKKLPNTQMAGLAITLMQDDATAVALWGMKAATIMLPLMAQQGSAGREPLLAAVADAFAKHPTGPMADEAYRALTLTHPVAGGQPLDQNQVGSAVPTIAPEIIKVFQLRVAQSLKGLPPDAWAETQPINFLTRAQVWNELKPEQQKTVMELMSALATASAHHFDQVENQRDTLAQLIQRLGGAFQVIGSQLRSQQLEQAGKAMGNITANSQPNDVLAAAEAIGPAVKSVPQFKDVAMTTSGAQ